jgi:hypothetical protein
MAFNSEMKASWIIIAILTVSSICLANETDIGIYYMDGTFQPGFAKPDNLHPFISSIVLSDSVRIPLDNVRGYTNDNGFHLKLKDEMGLPFFIRRTVNGRISLYESVQTRGGMTQKILYFSQDNNTTFHLDYKTLEPLVKNNPHCRKQLATYKLCYTLKLSSFVIAGGSAAYAYVRQQTEGKDAVNNDKILIGTFVSSVCVSILAHYVSEDYLVKAIIEYNK